MRNKELKKFQCVYDTNFELQRPPYVGRQIRPLNNPRLVLISV